MDPPPAVLALGWPTALSSLGHTQSMLQDPWSAALKHTRTLEGKGNFEKPVPIPKNCPEHPRHVTGETAPGHGLAFHQSNGICNSHGLTAT